MPVPVVIPIVRCVMNFSASLRHSGLLAAVLLLASTQAEAQILFQSSLDSGTLFTTYQEAAPSNLVTFGYDYSALGIPASPHGGGTTSGLRMAVNTNSTIQAVTVAPTGLSLSGQFRVTFDYWDNAVGPFPAGGTGSTEYGGGGVGFDLAGSAPRSGASIMIAGEAGATQDWRLDKGAAAQTLAAGFYDPAITTLNMPGTAGNYLATNFPGQQPPALQQTNFPASQTGTVSNGGIAFAWHAMRIDADSAAGTADFWVDGFHIGTLTQTGGAVPIAGGVSLTALDPFTSVSSASLANDLVFALFDNLTVTAIPEPGSAGMVLACMAGLLVRRRRSAE